MEKKTGIILTSLIVLIVGLLALNLFFFSNPIKSSLLNTLPKVNLIKAKPVPTRSLLNFPQVEPKEVTDLPMFLPVRRADLATIPPSAIDSRRLIFFLPDKAPIYALIDGKVRYMPAIPPKIDFQNVQLVSADGQFLASYMIDGEVLVQEGQWVNKGNLIAWAKKGKGISFLGGANLEIDLFENSQPLILDKATVENLKGIGEE